MQDLYSKHFFVQNNHKNIIKINIFRRYVID
jgi:hypothetical protein